MATGKSLRTQTVRKLTRGCADCQQTSVRCNPDVPIPRVSRWRGRPLSTAKQRGPELTAPGVQKAELSIIERHHHVLHWQRQSVDVVVRELQGCLLSLPG